MTVNSDLLRDMHPIIQGYKLHPRSVEWSSWDVLLSTLKPEWHGMWSVSEKVLNYDPAHALSTEADAVELAIKLMAPLPGLARPNLLITADDEDFIKSTLRAKWRRYDPINSSVKDLKTAVSLPSADHKTLDLFIHTFRHVLPDTTFLRGSKFVRTAYSPNVPFLLPIAQAGRGGPSDWLENLLANDTESAAAWRILPALADFVDVCNVCSTVTEANKVYACLKACPRSSKASEWRADSIRNTLKVSSWYHTPRRDVAEMVERAKDRAIRTVLWSLDVSGTASPIFLAYALGDSSETVLQSHDRAQIWMAESPSPFWKQAVALMHANQALPEICDETLGAAYIPKLLELGYLTLPFEVHHSIYPWNINKMLYKIYKDLKSPDPSLMDMLSFFEKFEPSPLKTKWLFEVIRNPSSTRSEKITAWTRVIKPPFVNFIPGEYSAYTLHGPMKDSCQLSRVVSKPEFAEIYSTVSDHVFWKPIIVSTVACWIAQKAKKSSAVDTLDQWNEHMERLLDGEILESVQVSAPKSTPIAPPVNQFKRELSRVSRRLTPENTEVLEALRFPGLKDLWPSTLPAQVSWPRYRELLEHIDKFRAGWGVPNLLHHLRTHVVDYINKGQLRDSWKMGFKRVRNIHELDTLLEKVNDEFLDTAVSLPWSSPGWTRLAVMSNTWNSDHLVRRKLCEILADHLVTSAREENHSQGIAFLLLDSFTKYSSYNRRFMRLVGVYLNSLIDPKIESPRTILRDLILDRFLERSLDDNSEGLALHTKLGKLLLIKESARAKENFNWALRLITDFATNRLSTTKNDWDVAFEVVNSASFVKTQQQRLGAALLKNTNQDEWKLLMEFFPWNQFRQHIDPLVHLGDLQASRNALCELMSPIPDVASNGDPICILETVPDATLKFQWLDQHSHFPGCQQWFVSFVANLRTSCIPEGADTNPLDALEELLDYSIKNQSIAAASLVSVEDNFTQGLDRSLSLISKAISDPNSSKVEKFPLKLDAIMPKLTGQDAIDRSRDTLSLIVTHTIAKAPGLFEKEQRDNFFKIAEKLVLIMGQERYVRAVKLLADISPDVFSNSMEKAETITRIFKFAMTNEESKVKAGDAETHVLGYDLPEERQPICDSDTFEQFRARDPNHIQFTPMCPARRDLMSIPKAVPAIGDELSVNLILEEPVLWLGSLSNAQLQSIGNNDNNLCTVLESEKHMKQFHFMSALPQFKPKCIQSAKANWIWALIPNQDDIVHDEPYEIARQLTASNFEGLDPRFLELANLEKEFWEVVTNKEISDDHPCKTIPENIKSKFWEGASVDCLTTPRSDDATLISLASTRQLSMIGEDKWADLGPKILSIQPDTIAAMQSARWSYILPVIHSYKQSHSKEYAQFAQKVLECPRDRFIRAFNGEHMGQHNSEYKGMYNN
ncbi:hypothetical protein PSACC_00104 [Paramicrosporidium saccamoebae]|uniref:Uncharacterized protein n=1 Tax=Paramicrosporidium saccamoebae TaxID=1246581 RepID=A0A2H9TQY0_9FUNG|nr:hypothetical protein PSACC_00104 [Paramicrosporidium saccamoebae]